MSSAMAWLARLRSALGTRFTYEIALLGLVAQIVVAHQPVEIERRRGAGVLQSRIPATELIERVDKEIAAPSNPSIHKYADNDQMAFIFVSAMKSAGYCD